MNSAIGYVDSSSASSASNRAQNSSLALGEEGAGHGSRLPRHAHERGATIMGVNNTVVTRCVAAVKKSPPLSPRTSSPPPSATASVITVGRRKGAGRERQKGTGKRRRVSGEGVSDQRRVGGVRAAENLPGGDLRAAFLATSECRGEPRAIHFGTTPRCFSAAGSGLTTAYDARGDGTTTGVRADDVDFRWAVASIHDLTLQLAIQRRT